MHLWAQSVFVTGGGLLVATGLAFTRGLPNPEPTSQNSVCSAPPGVASPQAPAQVGQQEARALLDRPGVVFVDARPLAEFEQGHIAGAVHLPLSASQSSLDPAALRDLAGTTTMIVYCSAENQCSLSNLVASALLSSGLADVRVLDGGFPRWFDNGYPAQAGDCMRCR